MSLAQSKATRGVTRNPSSAMPMAGRSSSSRGFVPWSALSFTQASTQPGTVTAWGEVGAGAVRPRSAKSSAVAAAGARPDPFSATGRPPRGA